MSYFDDLNEFTDEEIANNGVSSANDSLEGSAAENKKVFDKLPKYIAGRINIIISSLRSFASSIDAKITDLNNYIDSTFLYKRDLPSKVSVFENDSRYITANEVPDNLSSYNNDAGFITDEAVPTKLSQLENDTGFITDDAVPTKVSELENDTGFITDEAVPTKVSELENDAGFITDDAVPTKVSELENDAEYVKKTDVATPYDAGVVKVNSSGGISINLDNSTIYIAYATNNDIDGRTSIRPIVPANLEYAVKSVGDGYYITSTDIATAEKSGVVKVKPVNDNSHGISIGDDGVIRINCATEGDIKALANWTRPIVPATLEVAVKTVGDGYYVKTTDLATNGKCGVVMGNGVFGTGISANGSIYLERATNAEIDARSSIHKPITPYNLDYAVKAVGDGYYATVEQVGDIETALDNIIAIQNNYMGTMAANEGGEA